MDQTIEELQAVINNQNVNEIIRFKDIAYNIEMEIKLECLRSGKINNRAEFFHVDTSWTPRPFIFENVPVDLTNPIGGQLHIFVTMLKNTDITC